MLLVVQGGFVLRTFPQPEQEYLQVFKETPNIKMGNLQGPAVYPQRTLLNIL